MMTVHEVSEKTGVSIRALHHYDRIGLLRPTAVTEAGYRLYDDAALERLQQILLFRELQFPLAEIVRILDSPGFDRNKALAQQIALLEMRRDRLDGLLALARRIQSEGGQTMDFEAFSTKKIDAYAEEARRAWGHTGAYREYEEKSRQRSAEEEQSAADGLMRVIAPFHAMKDLPPDAPEVRRQVAALMDYITGHYYTCTPVILKALGRMYGSGGEMTQNIDRFAGEGTAAAAAAAIDAYNG